MSIRLHPFPQRDPRQPGFVSRSGPTLRPACCPRLDRAAHPGRRPRPGSPDAAPAGLRSARARATAVAGDSTPLEGCPAVSWKRSIAARVRGPYRPSTGPGRWPRARSRRWTSRTRGEPPGCPYPAPGASGGLSAFSTRRVRGPTIPSTESPLSRWRPSTAASVSGPYRPSTGPGRLPSARSLRCSARTRRAPCGLSVAGSADERCARAIRLRAGVAGSARDAHGRHAQQDKASQDARRRSPRDPYAIFVFHRPTPESNGAPARHGTRVGLTGLKGVSRVVRSERRSPRNATAPEAVATCSRVRRRTRQPRTEGRKERIPRRTTRLPLRPMPHRLSAEAAREKGPVTDRWSHGRNPASRATRQRAPDPPPPRWPRRSSTREARPSA